jgi:trehalose-6-phosphate synthase
MKSTTTKEFQRAMDKALEMPIEEMQRLMDEHLETVSYDVLPELEDDDGPFDDQD